MFSRGRRKCTVSLLRPIALKNSKKRENCEGIQSLEKENVLTKDEVAEISVQIEISVLGKEWGGFFSNHPMKCSFNREEKCKCRKPFTRAEKSLRHQCPE